MNNKTHADCVLNFYLLRTGYHILEGWFCNLKAQKPDILFAAFAATQGPTAPTAPLPEPPQKLNNTVLGRIAPSAQNLTASPAHIAPHPRQETAAPPPQPQQKEQPGSGGVFGGRGFSSIMQNKFKSQFVASGTAGRLPCCSSCSSTRSLMGGMFWGCFLLYG